MTDHYYPHNPPILQEYDAHQLTYAQLYHPDQNASFTSVPMGEIITEQPTHSSYSLGAQISASGIHSNIEESQEPLPSIVKSGIVLPGFGILENMPTFKIYPGGLLQGHTTCTPGYKIHDIQGNVLLTGTSDTLFCPLDSRQKSVSLRDANEDCIFQVQFTPSICPCDSQEKRCFALYSPLYTNPFGAIMFEAGVIKHSMKILNALESETFVVEFRGTHYVSIKGAEGGIVAVITFDDKKGEPFKYTLTFMEEVSTANKALFIGCALTLNLASLEHAVTRCLCVCPVMLTCFAIVGLSLGTAKRKKPITGR